MGQTATNLYFAGRLVYRTKNFVTTAVQDRLGSMGSYYPYGEEYATTQQDQLKFATYYRDTTTVLDYARNRYYSSTLGRFLTADPYRASGGPADPGSWNRYAYTRNDPVNRYDPSGLDDCPPESSCTMPPPSDGQNPPGSGTGGPHEGIRNPNPGQSSSVLRDLDLAKERLKADLGKKDCAKDFKNLDKVQRKLFQIGFSDYGPLQYKTQNGEVVPVDPTFLQKMTQPCFNAVGCYNSLTKSIGLNSSVNWDDPNSTSATLNGRPSTEPLLSDAANQLGVASMTAGQFMDSVILHELEHYNGTLGDPDKDPTVDKRIWNDCIK